jgi:hypothetical protein
MADLPPGYKHRPRVIDEYTNLPLTHDQRRYWRKQAKKAGHFVRPRPKHKAARENGRKTKIYDEWTDTGLPKSTVYSRRHKEQTREWDKRRREKLKADPVKYAEYRAKHSLYTKLYRARKKAEAERQAELEKANKYWKRKVKELNIDRKA